MSINQLTIVVAGSGLVLAAFRVNSLLGACATVIGVAALARGFGAVHDRRLRNEPVGPGGEWGLTASSVGVVLLITGSAGLALVTPVLTLIVVCGFFGEVFAAIGWSWPSLGAGAPVPGFAPILIAAMSLVGMGLAPTTLIVLTFRHWSIEATPAEGWRRVAPVAMAWLATFLVAVGLGIACDWLATTREVAEADREALASRRELAVRLPHRDHLRDDRSRCPACDHVDRAGALSELDSLERRCEAEESHSRSLRESPWRDISILLWLLGLTMLGLLRRSVCQPHAADLPETRIEHDPAAR